MGKSLSVSHRPAQPSGGTFYASLDYVLLLVCAHFFFTKRNSTMISPSELWSQTKALGCGGRLVPFYKAVCLYFVAGGGAPSLSAAALKCAPVLCLLLSVLLAAPAHQARYSRLVCAGLALSAAGDALLVWPQRLVAGMAAFAAAHACYIGAFGLRPRAPLAGAALLLGALAFARLLRPPGELRALVPAYALLLGAMAWRGAARPGAQRAGALLFAVSDAVLGYSLFGAPVPHARAVVMATYYLGQLGIALSALRPRAQPS